MFVRNLESFLQQDLERLKNYRRNSVKKEAFYRGILQNPIPQPLFEDS